MTQGALPLDAFSRYKLSLITTKFQQTQTDRKNKMKKSKPTPLDKQRAKRVEVTWADLEKIFNNGKPELSSRERETIDRYWTQKGFRDTTEEMLGKTSILIS
jgi:hypothetical protein